MSNVLTEAMIIERFVLKNKLYCNFLDKFSQEEHITGYLYKMQSPKNKVFSLVLTYISVKLLSLLCSVIVYN